MFSLMASDHELERKLAVVGCQLVDFLVKCDQEDLVKQLMDLLVDIGLCLSEVSVYSTCSHAWSTIASLSVNWQ